MSYIESKYLYKELVLIMENCEELSIPYKNVHGLEFDLVDDYVIGSYSLSFVVDDSCKLYMMHPDNGIDNDISSIIQRLSKWKDVTHLELISHDRKAIPYSVSWEGMSIDNDQEHVGQDLEIETHSDGTRYVHMVCKGNPSALPKY